MDLRHLRYFLAVAEELHFTRAAARLNMSQPPLSQIINRLEDDLGFKLFERSKRKVELTEAGKILLEESRSIIARAEVAVNEAARVSRGDVGHLKVAFQPWAEFTTSFAAIFDRFAEQHPEVVIDYRSLLVPAAVTALKEGRINVAFLTIPPDPDPALKFEVVQTDAIIAALPQRHRLADRQIIPLKLLANEAMVVAARDRVAAYYSLVEMLCQQAGFALHARHVVDHPQTTIALVAARAGVSLVPASYQNVRRPGVVYRPIKPTARIKMIVAWKADDRSPVVKAFLAVIRSVVASSKA